MRTTTVTSVIRLSPSGPRRVAATIAHCIERLSTSFGGLIGRFAARVDRLPPWAWPLLVAVAAWPDALWATRRLLDDVEEPLGIVAACALCLALWQARTRFRRTPRITLLGMAAVLVIVANLPMPGLQPLVRAAIGHVAIVVALASVADRDEPIAPYAGLAILALPMLSSLQLLAGLPLPEATADAALWLLAATGSDVGRTGTGWMIDGRDVVIATRGGLQLAWFGCFIACVTGWTFRLRNRAFVVRLPVVALAAWGGHVLHTTVLIAADAGGVAMTDAMDAAIGLLAYIAVGALIGFVFATGGRLKKPPVSAPPFEARPRPGAPWRLLYAGLLVVAASLPFADPRPVSASLVATSPN